MNKVLKGAVVCGALVTMLGSAARAEQRMTESEMNDVAGQRTLAGQICVTGARGTCIAGTTVSSVPDCQNQTPLNYNHCVVDPTVGDSSKPVRYCTQVTRDTCNIVHWIPINAAGAVVGATAASCTNGGVASGTTYTANPTDPNGC